MKNESKRTIACPSCKTEINVEQAIAQQVKKDLIAKMKLQEDEIQKQQLLILDEKKNLEIRIEGFQKKVDDKVSLELKNREALIRDKIYKELSNESSEEKKELIQELNRKSIQLQELNQIKSQLEISKRQKDELESEITLKKEKELSEKLSSERQKLQKQFEDQNYLKLKEREKVIDDLTKKLEEAKRQAEQGSMQLQGEIQEIEIIETLQNLYKHDEIIQSTKGSNGADVLQKVNTKFGECCGAIYYESKRTKAFSPSWIPKFKEDNRKVCADILVLVTQSLPNGIEKYGMVDGVWVCTFSELKELSLVLRYGLMKVHEVAVSQVDKGTKMEMLYSYLTSLEFRNQFEAIIEGFKSLQGNYHDEKLRMQKLWKQREKHLEQILTNAIDFYGSLKGIAGSSIPDIKILEQPKN